MLIMLMQLGEIIVIFIRPAQSIWYTILALPSALIATGILFKEKMWRKLAVFLFAYGYIDVIEYPIKIIVGSNNDFNGIHNYYYYNLSYWQNNKSIQKSIVHDSAY